MRHLSVYATLLLGLFVLKNPLVLADAQTRVGALLAARLEQERGANGEKMVPVRFGPGQLRDADATEVLAVLARYQNDPCWPVRHLAFRYAVWLAEVQPQPATRQEVVNQLVKGLTTGADRQTYKWLLTFQAEDFSGESKALIRESLAKDRPIRSVVLICGVANIQEQLPRLQELMIDELAYAAEARKTGNQEWYYTTGWAARLARARMGVQCDIKRCLELVETVEEQDRRVLTLLHDVGYIRQPQAIEHLRKYLESEKRLSPVKATVPGEAVANYVMSILAESVSDYPVKRRERRNYTEDEIRACRKWMAEQKEWKIIR